MKYIILTSSIFYLLGLKFTSNIDLNAKFQTDTVQTKKEIILPPKELKEERPKGMTEKKDSVTTVSGGSNELLAPYVKVRIN
ncbi:MAG: hypothetical protein A2W90_15820 [Bacteroidetes bacterium GWF2_42_66]|nr:MAG: hypothetical protein A2W89_04405 [Bacteroidetes bacterium GWE2_42_39]OFY43924.1 MAG: hypothetical protein A2W90_15820 [Bacteroidetes bacterium GWF2_42_66]HBL77552.1 hypothetical protein [Prolixibacteraceae bacterium]HCU60343.1 hypothetical protein [Prolixibacteraceae bacterium]